MPEICLSGKAIPSGPPVVKLPVQKLLPSMAKWNVIALVDGSVWTVSLKMHEPGVRGIQAYARAALLMSVATFALVLSGCTSFDPLNSTGEKINQGAEDYANDAILMNIVRSKLDEPISFVTVTSVTGTSSIMGSLGFGGVTFGPHIGSTPARDYLFGPNSVARSNSNVYNLSIVDDPGSFAALLSPINPALIAEFINQGYPRALLFFLFVDHIRKVAKDGTVLDTFVNDPDMDMLPASWSPGRDNAELSGKNPPTEFGYSISELATLLRAGLTAEIDVTSIPSGPAFPPSRLCIDPQAPLPLFAGGKAATEGPFKKALCANHPWLSKQVASPASGGSSAGSSSSITTAASSDGAIWVILGDRSVALRLSGDGKATKVFLPKDTQKPPQQPSSSYEFTDTFGNIYQLSPRSTYGVYNYLGALLRNHNDIVNVQSGNIVDIVSRQPQGGCFARVNYRSLDYCVPATANRTKKLFSLLHQLQELNTTPANAPAALTVTSTH